MNILRIVYDWPDENNITEGLAPAPYELSLAQVRLGHKVFVLCGNLNGVNLKSRKFKISSENSNLIVYNLPRAVWKFGPFLTTSLFVIPFYFYLKLTKNIDIIHNHGHLGVWLLVYKKLFNFIDITPIIGHYHIVAKCREDVIIKQGQKISFWAKYFEYPIHKYSDQLMADISSHIVTVSKDNIEEIISVLKVPENKVTLLETGVDTVRFTKEGTKELIEFPKTGNNERNLVYVGNGGRLGKRKNIDMLVESLVHLPSNFKLILWGKWDDELEIKVNKFIKDNKLESRVMYLGPVSYFKVDRYYRMVDIFCLPSSYEGLPKVVVEALACGCKVVASGFKIDKKIDDLYFLGELSAVKIAEMIEVVARNKSNYEGTRKTLESHYSWDSKAKILEKVYNAIQN